jgi:hypothetical protein
MHLQQIYTFHLFCFFIDQHIVYIFILKICNDLFKPYPHMSYEDETYFFFIDKIALF